MMPARPSDCVKDCVPSVAARQLVNSHLDLDVPGEPMLWVCEVGADAVDLFIFYILFGSEAYSEIE